MKPTTPGVPKPTGPKINQLRNSTRPTTTSPKTASWVSSTGTRSTKPNTNTALAGGNWRLQRQEAEQRQREREEQLKLEKNKKLQKMASKKPPEREQKQSDSIIGSIQAQYSNPTIATSPVVEPKNASQQRNFKRPDTTTPPSARPPLDKLEIEVSIDDEDDDTTRTTTTTTKAVSSPNIVRPTTTQARKEVDVDIVKASEVVGVTEKDRESQEEARLNKFMVSKKELTEEDILAIRAKQEEEFRAKQTHEKVDTRMRAWQQQKANEEWERKKVQFHESKVNRSDDEQKKKAANKLATLLNI